MSQQVPNAVNIKTADSNSHRYHAMESAADFYGCNRSDAVAYACDNVTQLVDAVETILQRDDLNLKQKREIAEIFSGRGLNFEVDTEVTTETG